MERKEFSLVPEWLKGGAGGGTGGNLQLSHQSLHQGHNGSLLSPSHTSSQAETARQGESDSSSHVAMSEADFDYQSLRRPGSSIGGVNVGSNLDRDSHLRGTDHDRKHDKDYENREWGKNRALVFTAINVKEKDRESTDLSALHLQRAGNVKRHDVELPLHRVNLMGASHRIMVSGEKEPATAILGAPTDGFGLPSPRAATPSLRSFASSESLASSKEAEVSHASSHVATSSQFIGRSNVFMKETTQAVANMTAPPIVDEPDLTRGLPSSKLAEGGQRLEELELRQSKQLISMKVTSIKNMVVDSREKSSPKVSQSVEMGPFVAPNDTQVLVAHRPLPVRHEYPKRTQNKLIVRNSNKKVIAPIAPSKLDGRSFVPLLGIFGSSEAMDQAQISQTSGPSALGNCRRNLKQLYGMRTVPITSMPLNFGTDGGATAQTREPGAGAEEKRSSVRNRTEFFNSLRRKAAESGASQSNFVRSDSVSQEKTAEVRNKGELEASLKISSNYAHDDATELQDYRTRDSAAQDSHRNTICSNNSHDTIIGPHMKVGKKVPPPVNGLIADEVGFVATRSSVDISVEVPDGPTCSEEEEEEAFLRSLGWEDNTGEDEALTEEEINAFYQQHGKFLATSRSSLHKQRSKDSVMHSDIDSPSPGSMSSGLGSSETDSDDELQVQQ